MMTGYTLAGPGSVTAGSAAALTLTPSGPATDSVTFSDGGHGGTFAPSSLSWSGSSAPKQVGYTQATPGTYAITATSGAGGNVAGSPFVLHVLAAPAIDGAARRRRRWLPTLRSRSR